MRHIKVFAPSFLVAFALQAPLLAELARRLINPSSSWLLASDLLIFFTCIMVANKTLFHQWSTQLLILVALVCFAVLSSFVNDLPAQVIYAGVRPFAMSFLSAVLGYSLVKSERGIKQLILMALFWSGLITGYAVLQVALGIDHPINILPEGVAMDANEGMGGYSDQGSEIFGFFRPTSIFFHTGKFGQVAFFMALIPMLFFLTGVRSAKLKPWILRALTVLGIVAVFVSGQRAAFVFILISTIVFLWRMGNTKAISRTLALALFLVITAALFGGSDFLASINARYLGMGSESIERLDQSAPFYDVLNDAGIFGQGVGLYSFGASSFMDTPEFVTEQAWLRLLAEWGVMGMLMILGFFLSVIHSCTKRSRYETKGTVSDVLRFASLAIAASLFTWGFTHDVLANTLTMQIAFTVFGSARGFADNPA